MFNYGLPLHHKPVKSQPPRRSSSSQAAPQTQNVQCQSRLVADLLTDEVPNPRMPKRGTQQRRLKSLDRKQPHGLLLSRLSTAVAKLLQESYKQYGVNSQAKILKHSTRCQLFSLSFGERRRGARENVRTERLRGLRCLKSCEIRDLSEQILQRRRPCKTCRGLRNYSRRSSQALHQFRRDAQESPTSKARAPGCPCPQPPSPPQPPAPRSQHGNLDNMGQNKVHSSASMNEELSLSRLTFARTEPYEQRSSLFSAA